MRNPVYSIYGLKQPYQWNRFHHAYLDGSWKSFKNSEKPSNYSVITLLAAVLNKVIFNNKVIQSSKLWSKQVNYYKFILQVTWNSISCNAFIQHLYGLEVPQTLGRHFRTFVKESVIKLTYPPNCNGGISRHL